MDNTGINITSIPDMKFVSVLQSDNTLGIMIVDKSYDPNKPANETTDGLAPEILGTKEIIRLTNGHTVDARPVKEGLSNQFIFGNGGDLITSQDQTFIMVGISDIGYNIIGAEGNSAASLTVGNVGESLGKTIINLTGKRYESEAIQVNSGLLEISEATTLGRDQSTLTLGVKGQTSEASVNNNGTIKGDVTLYEGTSLHNKKTINGDITVGSSAHLKNNGALQGTVTVTSNALLSGTGAFNQTVINGGTLYVGNSPGYQSHKELTLNPGTTLHFYIDGNTPASLTSSGKGTYSQLNAETINLNGQITLNLEIGLGLVAQGSEEFSLALIDCPHLVDNSGSTSPEVILSGHKELLKTSSFSWDDSGNQFIFTGQLDETVLATILGADAQNIANALWSSTSVVKNFAETMASQSGVPLTKDTTVWVSGLGNFISMSTTNTAHGFDYNGGGYALGADYGINKNFRMGLSFGQSFGTFKADQGLANIKQDGIMGGLYSQYNCKINEINKLIYQAGFAFGTISNKSDAFIGGNTSQPTHADWDDTVFSFNLKAAWAIKLDESNSLTPFIGMQYLNGSQDDFTERFDGGERSYSDGKLQTWSIPVGITYKNQMTLGGGQYLVPELTLAYVGDVSRDNPSVKTSIYGVSNEVEGSKPGRNALLVTAGTNWIINEAWSTGLFYSLDSRSNQTGQSANLSVRFSF